jgi:hypothetical protein
VVAACVPDGWKPAPDHDTFLDHVRNACYFQRIGMVNVCDLPNNPGNMQYLIDQTSRP